MPREHGITTETLKRFILDAGAVYKNYGETDEAKLGATRGGNQFTIEQEIKIIEMDGAKGPVKGGRRVINTTAKVVANLLEMTSDNFMLALAGSDSAAYPDATAKTHDSITRTREIADTDYLVNIALVGNISGSDTPMVCIIENPLADGNLELTTEDKEEAALEVTFTAHFDPAALDDEPWEIRYPNAAAGV